MGCNTSVHVVGYFLKLIFGQGWHVVELPGLTNQWMKTNFVYFDDFFFFFFGSSFNVLGPVGFLYLWLKSKSLWGFSGLLVKEEKKKSRLKILYSVCVLDNFTDQTTDCESISRGMDFSGATLILVDFSGFSFFGFERISFPHCVYVHSRSHHILFCFLDPWHIYALF